MPIRKIPANYLVPTGFIVSRKGGSRHLVYWEGVLEWRFYFILEVDPEVLFYEEQPVTIPYTRADGSESTYTPDVRVAYATGKTYLYEVKPSDKLAELLKTDRRKFRAAFGFAHRHGMVFKFCTKKKLVGDYGDNCRFLKPTLFYSFPKEHLERILAAMRLLRESTPRTLIQGIANNRREAALLYQALWRLVAERQILADLTKTLGGDCRLWLDEEPEHV